MFFDEILSKRRDRGSAADMQTRRAENASNGDDGIGASSIIVDRPAALVLPVLRRVPSPRNLLLNVMVRGGGSSRACRTPPSADRTEST